MSRVFYTILTAALNNGDSISSTIFSIREQEFKGFEHIVIDGGSTDGTSDILERYKKSSELKYISEPDAGIADALNKGLKIAQGKYILVLHADDRLIHPKILGNVHALLKREAFDIHSFPVFINDPGGKTRAFKPFPLRWWHHFKTIVPHQGAFVHRRVYERIGMYRNDFSIAMDYDFFYRAFKAKCSVSFQKDFVAIMDGTGISNDRALLKKRLDEEALVYKTNEENPMWRIAQTLFRLLYVPYKTKYLPKAHRI
jgi:glycosyltransferase involved in cell wall biosynthesis